MSASVICSAALWADAAIGPASPRPSLTTSLPIELTSDFRSLLEKRPT
jgi:hypothetical protein